MSRLHIHITVEDIEHNIRFYNTLFNQAPTVHQPDYAKWELADPAVNFAISTHGARTGLDHVGIQADDADELQSLQARLEDAGIVGHEQTGATCCYARSDKYWTRDPQGIAWEAFHTLDAHPTFGAAAEKNATGCCTPAFSTGCC
ncbi:MAG: ArsI/CadI family heavy metal resistance metalloenzyme [Thiohalobacterales bacterium]|nr:ArsI/CadI family heavy metal resistance metalloenzyme [Thiohalobacterales bacterium]